ncbi:MAG TPA: XdhC family protein [Vicinamibacterales bacterium]|nr:XdhC family protein [Vicinamibacterales bacterium]
MIGRLDEFFAHVTALQREGQPFVIATVVARRPPVSAHLGDRAIVFADGRMEGFVGGACSREIVRKQALEALAARRGRLVSIRPEVAEMTADAEHVVVPMTCASEGAVDVYVEPVVKARSLVVAGATPVADALMRLGRSVQYDVIRVVDAREKADVEAAAVPLGVPVVTLDALGSVAQGLTPDGAAIVASQGHYDDEALEVLLRAGVAYVGLVASRKRGAGVLGLLQERGVPNVSTVRNPAGLDLGARTPPEVALSVLAEIVQWHPAQSLTAEAPVSGPAPAVAAVPATATDPVCGMEVDVATARHTAEVDGVTWYFCCAHCRAAFLKQPDRYRPQAS